MVAKILQPMVAIGCNWLHTRIINYNTTDTALVFTCHKQVEGFFMDLLTIEQVADLLACSDDQVRVLINSGQLNYVNIGTGKVRRCVRISGDALHEFIRSRQAVATSLEKPNRRSKPTPRKDWV